LRAPSITLISILTVALGVGAGTAPFSVVKAVLLNPLPYPDPGRLAWIAEINDHDRTMQVGFQSFLDWQHTNRTFAALAGYEEAPAVVSGGALPQSTVAAPVTEDFFRIMGANPILGRTFTH